jgi:hypothetical protein
VGARTSSPPSDDRPGVAAPPAAPSGSVSLVKVKDPQPGLTVSIDGGPPRPLPATVPRAIVSHLLIFQAPGYRSRSMKLVDASKDNEYAVSLTKLP